MFQNFPRFKQLGGRCSTSSFPENRSENKDSSWYSTHEDSIWIQCNYKLKVYEIENDTGIENNLMQSKMQVTDWQFAVSTVDFFLSVREEIGHDKGHSQAQVNESLTAAVYQMKGNSHPPQKLPMVFWRKTSSRMHFANSSFEDKLATGTGSNRLVQWALLKTYTFDKNFWPWLIALYNTFFLVSLDVYRAIRGFFFSNLWTNDYYKN